jgi:trehalose 6-phosphate synthase
MNRLVVVSNRVPLPSSGSSAGGLAVALGGLMERKGGLWFGWSGRVVEENAQATQIEQHGAVRYATIDLTGDEYEGYYNRYSNSVLWPLLHSQTELMRYDRADTVVYRNVNAKMADALVPLLGASDVVWIHDYHLLPLGSELRSRGVRNAIGLFLHIPFASPDVLSAVPEMAALVRDMLAADLIGFQTGSDLEHFAQAAQMLAGAVRLSENAVQIGSRTLRLGVFPVEIDALSFAQIAKENLSTIASERLRASLGDAALILGIDRLDPTKGLMQRMAGFRALMDSRPEWRKRATFLQIAATSRKEVDSYRTLRASLEAECGSLNAEIGTPDWTPLRLLTTSVDRSAVAGFMRMARVGLVTPVRDGMNLVAKEFIAAQDPTDPGVLVLSTFAGAAKQLSAAIIINPHDSDSMADALNTALKMPLAERQHRWRACWSALEGRSPVGWGRGFVAALIRATTAKAESRKFANNYGKSTAVFGEAGLFDRSSEATGSAVAMLRPSADASTRDNRPLGSKMAPRMLN